MQSWKILWNEESNEAFAAFFWESKNCISVFTKKYLFTVTAQEKRNDFEALSPFAIKYGKQKSSLEKIVDVRKKRWNQRVRLILPMAVFPFKMKTRSEWMFQLKTIWEQSKMDRTKICADRTKLFEVIGGCLKEL